jgi:cell division initiation protein
MHNDDDTNQTDDTRRMSSVDRNLSVSPIEMRQRKFSTVMRGFDREEVVMFLGEAATAYETALRDNDRLRDEVVKLEASLNQFRELEGSLKNTLMSAQKVADDMHDNAVQESSRVIRQAEARAEMQMHKAQAKLELMQQEIDAMRLKRRDTEVSLEATISTLRNTLDFVREQDRRDREGNVVVAHRPQVVQSA